MGGSFDFTKAGRSGRGVKIDPEEVAKGKREGGFRDKLKSRFTPYVELINGVPYIIYLEYGWSQSAPAGMLRVSMREMRGELPKYMSREYIKNWKKFKF